MIHPEQSAFRPPQRSYTEIDRDEIVRQTLKEVETRLMAMNVNHTYRQAFKVIVRLLNGMKP